MSKIDFLLAQIQGEMQVLNANETATIIGGGVENQQPTQDKKPTLPDNGTMYGVFDRSDSKITMFWDGGTPDDKSDDVAMFSGKAHNNVTRSSNGQWPNGEYSMLDRSGSHLHPNASWKDTASGAYGESGIYRANPFYDDNSGITRNGMGVHSGRENIKDFENRKTEGCIRVEQETMDAIDEKTKAGWKWDKIIVQD